MCERQKYKYGVQRKAQKANPDQFHILKEHRKNPMMNQSISTCEKVRLSHAAYMCVCVQKEGKVGVS